MRAAVTPEAAVTAAGTLDLVAHLVHVGGAQKGPDFYLVTSPFLY